MRKTLKTLAIVVLSLSIIGCTIGKRNKYMDVVDADKQYAPAPDDALLVFERESSWNAEYYNFSMWDITEADNPKFVGLLKNKMKTVYTMKPGEYYFLVHITGTYTIMKANVKEGRIYSVLLSTRRSKRAHRGVTITPTRKGEAGKITPTRISIPNDLALSWANTIQMEIKAHIPVVMEYWNSLSSEGKAAITINYEDGHGSLDP